MEAYEEHADRLFRFLALKVSDREKAKDLLQDVFVRTWEYLCRGQKIAHMSSFLFRVARNLVVDEYRRAKSASLDELLENGVLAEDVYSDEGGTIFSEAREAMEGLSRLSPEAREVIEMRYFGGLGPKEIAAVLGESENTISVRLNRALKKLREILKYETNH